MAMPTWAKGGLILAITFAAGTAAGVAYERRSAPMHHASEAGGHDAMHMLHHELELDSAQQKAITEILARRQGTIDSTWHAMQPHVRQMMSLTLDEIGGVLRPDQQAKFRRIVESKHPHMR